MTSIYSHILIAIYILSSRLSKWYQNFLCGPEYHSSSSFLYLIAQTLAFPELLSSPYWSEITFCRCDCIQTGHKVNFLQTSSKT